MISEKRFLEYQLQVERRFSEMERKNAELAAALSANELKHKIEMQKLLLELKKPYTPPELTEKEKQKAQNEAGVLLEYCEDPELLKKLGFKLNQGGADD